MNVFTSCRIGFREILVAFDISDVSATALAYSKAIAKRYSSHILLLHVSPPPRHLAIPEGGWADAPVTQQGEAEVEALGSELRDEGYAAEAVNSYGSIAREIIRHADAHHVDLVVLGTHGKHGVERLIFGSRPETIIHDCEHPVLTVGPAVLPPQNVRWSPKRIICIATPGATSAEAAAYGYCLAHEIDARFALIYAEDPGSPPGPGSWQEFEDAFDRALPEGRARHIRAEDYFSHESSAQSIVDAAITRHADLVVLGVKSAFPGSTHFSSGILPHVLLHAPCPVLTINSKLKIL